MPINGQERATGALGKAPRLPQVKNRVIDNVGIIELDNPPHQFMTFRMVAELDELTAKWEADSSVRAIVITGTKPGTFITHFSVEELSKSAEMVPDAGVPSFVKAAVERVARSFEVAHRFLDHFPGVRKVLENSTPDTLKSLLLLEQIHRVFVRLERMNKVVIAAINGTAMGGGCELALACDYRLMAKGDHVIGLIEVLGGIIPGAGGTQRLVATVGRAKAVEMALNGELLAPEEAERIGLITRAVDAEKLMDEAMTLARRMATRPPMAVGGAKRAMRVGTSLSADEGLVYEKLAFIAAGMHPDAKRLGRKYLCRFRDGASARQIFDELR
jgi:enoyl-CoA hydratase/carnithine racemase